jgi:hypothetical protein
MPKKYPLDTLVISAELNHLDFTVAKNLFTALCIMFFYASPSPVP